MKTLKTFINEYFEENVESSERTLCVFYDSFLNVYYDLMERLENEGVMSVFCDWYDYYYEQTPSRWNLVSAIQRYIMNVLEPEYRKLSIN